VKDQIDIALQTIEDDYQICLRIIGRYFEYLETCGLKEFNRYSRYKWTYDRDKTNGYSYVCIRFRSSMMKKCLIKKRPYIEKEDLYRWVENKQLIQEALDEAYWYISQKVEAAKAKIEAIKATAEDYEEKLDGLDDEAIQTAKKLGYVGDDDEAESC